jgi:replicative DNA helicase
MDEKIVVMVNEDSKEKWQRELWVWICNNILKYDLQKHIVRDGKYSDEVKNKLHEAADWLKNKTQNHTITIIPFLQYHTSKAIKAIRKYAALGVKYFILDTFKMDAGKVSSNSWLEMQQAMVNIKDVVKTEALNVHILITFQLEKGSSVMRYYTQNNIGLAKNIIDVASTCIMVRDIFEDEYTDKKRNLQVYRLEGINGKTKIVQKLDKNKNYQILFIVKNQEGAANSYQIVIEHDKSRNIINEVGICNISPDF